MFSSSVRHFNDLCLDIDEGHGKNRTASREVGVERKDDNGLDEGDIQELFDRISEHFEGADEGARGMFEMLVKTALRYRDMLVHSSGKPLTVGETREALDEFMGVIKTHEMPKDLDKRIHDLVIMWLEEIKEKVHH